MLVDRVKVTLPHTIAKIGATIVRASSMFVQVRDLRHRLRFGYPLLGLHVGRKIFNSPLRKVGFGQNPRQPGQGGNAAAVTSLFWVRVRSSTSHEPMHK